MFVFNLSILILVLASVSNLALGNSIRCEKGHEAGHFVECKVKTGTLFGKQTHLSNFQVKYSMSCNRNSSKLEKSTIFVALKSGVKVYLDYGAKNTKLDLGEGFGPLLLGDDDPGVLFDRSFNDCFLIFELFEVSLSPKVIAELQQFVKQIQAELPDHLKQLVSYQSRMIAAAGAEPSMACMIASYENNPFYADSLSSIITDMKNIYFATYARQYDRALYSCPWEGDLESELAACQTSAVSALCAFQTLYLQQHEWVTSKLNEAMARQASFQDGLAADLLQTVRTELEAALKAAETGIYR